MRGTCQTSNHCLLQVKDSNSSCWNYASLMFEWAITWRWCLIQRTETLWLVDLLEVKRTSKRQLNPLNLHGLTSYMSIPIRPQGSLKHMQVVPWNKRCLCLSSKSHKREEYRLNSKRDAWKYLLQVSMQLDSTWLARIMLWESNSDNRSSKTMTRNQLLMIQDLRCSPTRLWR